MKVLKLKKKIVGMWKSVLDEDNMWRDESSLFILYGREKIVLRYQ